MNKRYLSLLNPIYLPAWFLIGTLWLITRLPFKWQIKIGETIGKTLFLFPTQLKHITATNIKLCFPNLSAKEQAELAKKNFISLGIGLIEAGIAWWLPDNKLQPVYKIYGFEHAEAAFARGKGLFYSAPILLA
jgi:KDO2-lipid IV(A) lauroyltransferase